MDTYNCYSIKIWKLYGYKTNFKLFMLIMSRCGPSTKNVISSNTLGTEILLKILSFREINTY